MPVGYDTYSVSKRNYEIVFWVTSIQMGTQTVYGSRLKRNFIQNWASVRLLHNYVTSQSQKAYLTTDFGGFFIETNIVNRFPTATEL